MSKHTEGPRAGLPGGGSAMNSSRAWDPSTRQSDASWARARNKLRDLAPEMAEAILRVTDWAERSLYGPGMASDGAVTQLHAVAEKLRAIDEQDGPINA